MKTYLQGHTSPDTAYLVSDYPYGFRLRCKIRYWVEVSPSKGARIVSQTTNPKVAGERWNKPKASTYARLGAALYLDEDDHVQSARLSECSSEQEILDFVQAFPGAHTDTLAEIYPLKLRLLRARSEGRSCYKLNGIPLEMTESELKCAKAALPVWEALGRVLNVAV